MSRPLGRLCKAVLLAALVGCKPNATQLVEQAVQARGGLERLRSVQTEQLSGRIFFGGQGGTLRVEFKRPDRMRMEIRLPQGVVVRLFDGASGWTWDASSASYKPMSAAELEKARREADMDGPLVDSEAKGIRIAVAGERLFEGRATDELEVHFKDGTEERYQLDAVTHEPIGWSEPELIDGKEVERSSVFRASRRMGGVLFPTSIETAASGSRPAQRILIERIELNAPIDDARFRPPSADGGPLP